MKKLLFLLGFAAFVSSAQCDLHVGNSSTTEIIRVRAFAGNSCGLDASTAWVELAPGEATVFSPIGYDWTKIAVNNLDYSMGWHIALPYCPTLPAGYGALTWNWVLDTVPLYPQYHIKLDAD